MVGRPVMPENRGSQTRWQWPSIVARLACALGCLLVAICGAIAAEPEVADSPAVASASDLSNSDTDADNPRPLAFNPSAVKPLTAADLPPPNVLATSSVLRGPRLSFSGDWRAGSKEYSAIIEREALAFDLPPALLDAVVAVESRYNSAVVGMDGEIGLMQVLPATARMLGFTGSKVQLAEPGTNLHYGAKYLAGAWRLAGQDLCTAAMKYRAGHGETRFSFRSVDYCVRIRNHLAVHGVAVKGEVPQPTFGMPVASGALARPSSRNRASSTVNLAGLNARLRVLTDKVFPRNSH